MRIAPIATAARSLVWSWSHDTCLIAVDTVGPMSGGSVPWPLSGGRGPVCAAFPDDGEFPSIATLVGKAAHSNNFLRSRPRRAGHDAPRDAGEIVLAPFDRQSAARNIASQWVPGQTRPRTQTDLPTSTDRGRSGRRSDRHRARRAAIEGQARVVEGDLGRQTGECRARRYRAGCETTASNLPATAAPQSPTIKRARSARPSARHCAAPSSAARARCRCQTRSQPGIRRAAPAECSRCRCRDRESGNGAGRGRATAASTASTMVSVSGRGSRVSATGANSRPQNSRRPRMRLNGSRADHGPARTEHASGCVARRAPAPGAARSSAGVRPRAEATNRRARATGLVEPGPAPGPRRPRRAASRGSPLPRLSPRLSPIAPPGPRRAAHR